MRIINEIMKDVVALQGGASREALWITPTSLRHILERHLVPHEHVAGAQPLICYFQTEEDREEFVQAVMEVKPGMRSIKL